MLLLVVPVPSWALQQEQAFVLLLSVVQVLLSLALLLLAAFVRLLNFRTLLSCRRWRGVQQEQRKMMKRS